LIKVLDRLWKGKYLDNENDSMNRPTWSRENLEKRTEREMI